MGARGKVPKENMARIGRGDHSVRERPKRGAGKQQFAGH